jgi:hypothetical protein
MDKMNFNFSSIKPTVDVSVLTHKDTNKAVLEFSDSELMLLVVGYLVPQDFISTIMPIGKDMIAIVIKDTFDSLQVLERICTTLELHNKSVTRKFLTSSSSDFKMVQSYVLGG